MSWLERHQPEVYARILEAQSQGDGALAQAWNHMILPLANERDVRTQVRWGLADFRHRFGTDATGMWLPETAVNDAVLGVLAEEGVRFTILAPGQARAVRALVGADGQWKDVDDGTLDTRLPYCWLPPSGDGPGRADIVFYDGPLSHDLAFSDLPSEVLVDRATAAGGRRGGLVTVALDGETFGHHHKWAERGVAYALTSEAPRRGVGVSNLNHWVAEHEPPPRGGGAGERLVVRPRGRPVGAPTAGVPPAASPAPTSGGGRRCEPRSTSCATPAPRSSNAGAQTCSPPTRGRCATPTWRSSSAPRAPTSSPPAGIDGDRVVAFTLLEAQRQAMLMYTSCGWFFHDLAGLETVQVLRYAARAIDLLEEVGETPPVERVPGHTGEGREPPPR